MAPETKMQDFGDLVLSKLTAGQPREAHGEKLKGLLSKVDTALQNNKALILALTPDQWDPVANLVTDLVKKLDTSINHV